MHTKGPWELRENWVYPKGKDDDICHLSQSYLRNHGTRMANGALIAAAPEMLEALERVGCQYWACPGPDKPIEDMATCFVCATIRKAKGV